MMSNRRDIIKSFTAMFATLILPKLCLANSKEEELETVRFSIYNGSYKFTDANILYKDNIIDKDWGNDIIGRLSKTSTANIFGDGYRLVNESAKCWLPKETPEWFYIDDNMKECICYGEVILNRFRLYRNDKFDQDYFILYECDKTIILNNLFNVTNQRRLAQ